MPAMDDRARQALYLHALQPMAATVAAPNAEGFRPKRQCAEAIAQGCNVLRQPPSAPWIVAGAIHGFFDNRAFSWREAHIPLKQGVRSQGRRSGGVDHGALSPPRPVSPTGGASRLGSVTWCWTDWKPACTGGQGSAESPPSMTAEGGRLPRPRQGAAGRSRHDPAPAHRLVRSTRRQAVDGKDRHDVPQRRG